MAEKFSRPASGHRLKFGGIKTNSSPDSMPEHKYPYAQNVRGYGDHSTQSRPQLVLEFNQPASGGTPLGIDPVGMVVKVGTQLCTPTGATLVARDTGYSSLDAAILPFRPSASPAQWDYVWDSVKQTKINPATNLVKKIGLVEPQLPCDAAVQTFSDNLFNIGSGVAGWIGAGTATGGNPALGARVTDIAGTVLADPVFASIFSIQVGSAVAYQKFMYVSVGGHAYKVMDVFNPPQTAVPITILSIRYYSGTTGRCVVVPQSVASGPGNESQSIYDSSFLGSLRRGSMLQIGAEYVYVWNVSTGPDGTICFETSTTNPHTNADTITGIPAIQVIGGSPSNGQTITSPDISFAVTTGIGTETYGAFPNNFFLNSKPEDIFHLSIQVDVPDNLAIIRVLLSVQPGGGFGHDYYYYDIRPSDLQPVIDNTPSLTQLGGAQLIAQRAQIDQEIAAAANNQATTHSSAQFPPGLATWGEFRFPLRAFTKVGNDQTKTLTNATQMQILFQATANVNVLVNSISVHGGGEVDTGDDGAPYRYRFRARDSSTGTASNWSPDMRYGVVPRRQIVTLNLPATYPDPQADTFDIQRQGGTLEDWTFVGTTLIASGSFNDNYSDAAISSNPALPEDNYEPFPSIGAPLNAGSATIVGNVAVVDFGVNISKLLPGNEIICGPQVYTTWSRPTLISGTQYLVQLVENGSAQTGAPVSITEPLYANALLPYVFGPDVNGVFFAVGDPNRPGGVYNTNPQNPDGASDSNFTELSPVSEPLVNGCLLGPTPVIASTKRWWQGIAAKDAEGNLKYNWSEIPVGYGLATPWCLATDGKAVYFLASDGIRMHAGGPSESLTNDDLYNLFPHEGIFPADYTYNGNTLRAPAYQFFPSLHLVCSNGFLYFDYVGSSDNLQHTLVMDLRTRAWCPDVYSFAPRTMMRHSSSYAAPITSGFGGTTGGTLTYAADDHGNVYVEQSSPTPSSGENVACVLATWEDMAGDIRANKMYGDASVDVLAAGGNITVTPTFLGVSAPGLNNTLTGAQSSRQSGLVVDIAGEQLFRSFGLIFNWTDQGVFTMLYSWQPSYVPQPEDTGLRFTDWDDAGTPGNKFFQGFELEADTGNIAKSIKVRDADTLAFHDFTNSLGQTNSVKGNGQQRVAYSFNTPFNAHLVRFEPQDTKILRNFGVRWITQPTPEVALTWQTQPMSHGLKGYQHVQHILLAYNSTATVIFLLVIDGTLYNYSLPSTAGAWKKQVVMLQPVKGLVFQYGATSVAGFQISESDCEIFAKEWGAEGPYNRFRIGGEQGMESRI